MSLLAVLFLVLASPLSAADKDDEVILKNGDHFTGEIQKLEQGVLYFKPSYVLSAIELDWTKVDWLKSRYRFNVNLTSGLVYTGQIGKVPAIDENSQDFTITDGATVVRVRRSEVIMIRLQELSYLRQLNGSVSFGFTFASDNDQIDTSMGAEVSYRGQKNVIDVYFSSTFSGQSNAPDTQRQTLTGQYLRLLNEEWFVAGLTSFLTSSQQELELRSTFGGGLGLNLVRTDRTNFEVLAGLVATRERYSPSSGFEPEQSNAEVFMGMNLMHYRFKKFDLSSHLFVYPSLTSMGRVRTSSETTLSWELFKDFYWDLSVYENYDSNPPVSAPKNDFGVAMGLAWKF